MRIEVETGQIDRKYEGHRLKSRSQEKALLASIAARGIEEPLRGVLGENGSRPILLDGFKRLRCAIKIGANIVPFASLAGDEAQGILQLIRNANARGLTLLEQARLVDELKSSHGMSVVEIARRLERSPSWVVVRINVLGELSDVVRDAVFAGRFPAYSVLYTLRQFRRLNGATRSDTDAFVQAASGKQLSTRDIECLASAYFRGGSEVRRQIVSGDILWSLGELKEREREAAAAAPGLTDLERRVLRDLELLQGAMGRLGLKLPKPELKGPSFFAQAACLVEGVLSRIEPFIDTLRGFYDRTRQAQGGFPSARRGDGDPGDRQTA